MSKIVTATVIVVVFLSVIAAPLKAVATEIKPTTAQQSTDLGSYHALLIGVGAYEEFGRLKTPVVDVEEIGNLLKNQYGFEDVTYLTDKTDIKPTASNILNFIREKAKKLTDKDNLLIYYAGHGFQDDLTATGYWIPVNGKPDDPSTWISHDQIRSLLESNRIKIKNFMLIADSCYSGNMTRSIAITKEADEDTRIQKTIERGLKKSREVITSGGNEPVEDGVTGSNHSRFAHYFLKALQDNKSRYMDMGTLLYDKIRPEVTRMGRQTPERSRVKSAVDEDGFFVLTKIGIADLIKKPDLQDENVRLRKELELAKQELNAEKKKQDEYQSRLAALTENQKQLENERNKINEIDKANKADELRLQAVLKEKNQLSQEKQAELEKEKMRIADLNRQIELERSTFAQKEHSMQESEDSLRRLKNEIDRQSELQKENLLLLDRRKAEIESKEKALKILAEQEEQRARSASERVKQEEERANAAKMMVKAEYEKQRQAEEAARKAEEATKKAELEKKSLDAQVAEAQIMKTKLINETQVASGVMAKMHSGDGKGRFVEIGNVVFDKKTNLMWLKDANYSQSGKNFDDAEQLVTGLNVDGFNDWRIPSKEDWRTLIGKNDNGIDNAYPDGHPFKNVVIVGSYWVSSAVAGPSGINMGNGSLGRWNRKNPGFVWPVRDATPEEIIKIKSQEK